MKTNMNSSKPHGFTLIELLVVIGIIGVLASLLLPALGGARVSAKRVKCANNQRQIGIAFRMYADDHEGWLPQTTHGVSGTNGLARSWINTVSEYIGHVDKVRICPADPNADQRLATNSTSYVPNEYTFVDRVSPFGGVTETYRRLDKLRKPTETILLFTIADSVPASAYNDHTHSRGWRNWPSVLRDIAPDRFNRGGRSADHTSGNANYLYADSHVEPMDALEFKRLIDAGENPAKPPAL